NSPGGCTPATTPPRRISTRSSPGRPVTSRPRRRSPGDDMTRVWTARPATIVAAWVLFAPAVPAQLAPELKFTPYHADGIYAVKETVGWTLHLPQDVNIPVGAYTYTVKKNNFGPPIKSGTLELKDEAVIEAALDEPGMVFVQVTPPAGAGGR